MEDRNGPARFELSTTARARASGLLDSDELYVGVPFRRMVAYLIDVVLIAIAAFAFGVLFSLLGLLTFGLLTPFGIIALFLLPLAYHTWFLGTNGATPGMAWLGLEVRSLTGARPDYFQAAVMTILFYATVLPTSYLILLVALFNERRRTLHDFLSGVIVLRAAVARN